MTDKQVAIITGAGSGIGRNITIGLLKEGYQVVLAGRKLATLQETIKLGGANAKNSLAVPTDVANPELVKTLFTKTKDKFGRLDLLFNNAGITAKPIPLEHISFDDWVSVVGTNLTGPFLCTQEAFKMMKSQDPIGGRIINNGSISAHVPRPSASPYNITKSGITGLTKSTSLDGRPFNIACGQIDIGNVSTEMTQKMSKGVLQASGSRATEPTFDISHVVDAFIYMAKLPLNANVPFITVMANGMPYIGRG